MEQSEDIKPTNIELYRENGMQHDFPSFELFRCIGLNSLFKPDSIFYNNEPYVLRRRVNYRKWVKRDPDDRKLGYLIDDKHINVILDISYDKLIKDEQIAAIYKAEMCALYAKINLIAECFIPDIITHMKRMI